MSVSTERFPLLRDEGTFVVRTYDGGEGPFTVVVFGALVVMRLLGLFQFQREPHGFYLVWAGVAGFMGIVNAFSAAQALWNRSEVHLSATKLRLRSGPFPYWRERGVPFSSRARIEVAHDDRWVPRWQRPRFRVLVVDANGIPWPVVHAPLSEAEARYLAKRIGRAWKAPIDLSKLKVRKKR